MIDELDVHDIALIKDASIRPSSAMTVITGETGAGKTALLAACRLVMGQRADRDMVRDGSPSADVEGRLYLDEEGTEREVVVSRSVTADGRSRVKIDGRMASVTELAELIGPTISLCSQHDQVTLIRPAMHRIFLDRWAQIPTSALFADYASAYETERQCFERLQRLEADLLASDAKLEEARFTLRQIDGVGPTVEDYEELISALNKSENAELLARASSEAHATLSGDQGVLDLMNAAIASLEQGSAADPEMSAFARSLRDALFTVEDVARDVSRYDDAFEFDAASVGLMQDRVAAYQSLMRAFGPTVEDVVARGEEARGVIEAQENSDASLETARTKLAEARDELFRAGTSLHEERARQAPRFAAEMNAILADLGMGNSSLSCDVVLADVDAWTESGPDDVSFMFMPAPGMQPRPLSKIASGGELGRVMLALHVAMGDRDSIPTLVFDEVDAGVGGTTAGDLGNVLARLSETHQVIVVTHSAQIAARADKHYIVSKASAVDDVHTEISEAEGDVRVREIARMLSGTLTDASLVHARELLR